MKVPPITLDTPSLGELAQRVNNQSKLIEEQQRVLNKLQHPHPDQSNSMTALNILHPQLPPYDPSIPLPQITSTPYRVNDLDGERIIQVDGLPDVPSLEYTHSNAAEQNKYSDRYYDNNPMHNGHRNQNALLDSKTLTKQEVVSPYS